MVLAAARTFIPAENVVFWHGWLLFFHALNALLVFALVRRLSSKIGAAWVALLIFALHPLGSALLNNINYFGYVLGLTLSLSSLNAYLSFIRKGKWGWYVLSLIALVLALGCARQSFVLGVILFVYELAFERRGVKKTALRISPFLLIPLLLSPIWLFSSPHPLHFKYVEIYEGSFWHGLFSFIGGTGQYFVGMILTGGLLGFLHETVQQIYSASNLKFIGWAIFDFVLLGGAIWALAKKKGWAPLGIVFVILCLLPYASVAYNRVVEYISWKYFYFPLAGFAIFGAGIHEMVARISRRAVRRGLQAACLFLLIFWGARTIQLNWEARSPIGYWLKVVEINENSQIGLYELGKAYLADNQPKHALHFLFAPMVKDVKNPCLAMSRYYCRRQEFLASAVHLRFGSGKEKTGMVLAPSSQVASELLMSAGALDHAEENLGKILMVDPNDAPAMGRLAQVWFYKGFVSEAYRMVERIRQIDPLSGEADRLDKKFHGLERDIADNPDILKINPPSPGWLNYVMTQERSSSLRDEIIALSDRMAEDPIIQLEAVISLLEKEDFPKAAEKVEPVVNYLSGFSYAMAVACRALVASGDYDRAIPIGMRAVALDSQNTLAWDSLAMAHAHKSGGGEESAQFMQAVAEKPSLGSIYYYNLAQQKIKEELYEEAVALLEKSVNCKPDYYEAVLELGKVYLNVRKGPDAVQTLERARSLKTDDAQVHQFLGRAYMTTKQNDKGIESLRTAIKIDPEKAEYHYFLAFALDMVGRKNEAVEEYRRAIKLNPNYADAHFKLGNCLFLEKKIEEAGEHYRDAARIQPDYEYIHLNLSSVLMSEGKLDEAIAEVESEIRFNPAIHESYDRMIRLCCQKGNYDRARDAARQAKEKGFTINQESQNLLNNAPQEAGK